jgi:hypothetical protein
VKERPRAPLFATAFGLIGFCVMKRRSGILLSGILVGCIGAMLACDPPPLVGKGGACNSLSDCKPGLACLDEKCTDELDDIAGEVPVYAMDAAVDAAPGGG